MKKKTLSSIFTVCCTALLLLTFTACGETAQKSSTDPAATPVEATTSVPDCCGG